MNFIQGNPIKIYITDLDEDQDDDIFLIYCGLDQTDYDGSADVWLKKWRWNLYFNWQWHISKMEFE